MHPIFIAGAAVVGLPILLHSSSPPCGFSSSGKRRTSGGCN
jgi:hypothetical protein